MDRVPAVMDKQADQAVVQVDRAAHRAVVVRTIRLVTAVPMVAVAATTVQVQAMEQQVRCA